MPCAALRARPGHGIGRAVTAAAILSAAAAGLVARAAPAPAPRGGGEAAAAIPAPPPIGPQAYAARRQSLVRKLQARLSPGESGLFLALGTQSGGLDLPRQRASFSYLSGVEALDAALVLPVGAPGGSETLFLHEPTPRQRVFDRPPLAPGRVDWRGMQEDAERQAARQATGFKNIEPAHDLPQRLAALLDGVSALFVAAEPVAADAPLGRELDLAARLRDRHPGLRVLDARAELEELRLVKEPAELERIEAAVAATLEGFRRAAPRIRPGSTEAAVQADMEAGFRLAGARRTAFSTIVASGPRSTILHYMRNEHPLGAGELVVIDAGAERDGYAADVTRTFPVSGRFTQEQRRLYDLVLAAQEAGIRAARPGVTLDRLDALVKESLARDGQAEAMLHRCCHFVGLEVHDVGGRDVALAEGMVLTIEPGVYLPERGTGIRIEDTFVVTAGGVRSLSGALPRRAEEIERFLAAAR